METLLIIAAVVVVGMIILFAITVTRTSKLNVDPLQNHLMRILSGLNNDGHTRENRERFTALAAGYFHHYGIKSQGEIRTRLAHALSFVRLTLMSEDYERSRRFLRTWTMPAFVPPDVSAVPQPPRAGKADIFLSYAREDREEAQIIIAHLAANNLKVWWDDQIQTGERWEAEIKDQLDQARWVLVLWSGFASVSEWVRTEAQYGREQNKLVPAYLRKCRLPTAFADLQTADLSEWDGDPGHPEWKRVIAIATGRAATLKA